MAFITRCSDGFSGSGATVGQSTDNAAGGTASLVWLSAFKQGASNQHTEGSGLDSCTAGSFDYVAVTDTAVLVQRATITASSSVVVMSHPVVQIRWSASVNEGTAYVASGNGAAGSAIVLQRLVSGVWTTLATAGVWNNGDTVAIEVTGNNQLVVYKNGSSIITFDDSANTSVPAGVGSFGNPGTYDNFKWEINASTIMQGMSQAVHRAAFI